LSDDDINPQNPQGRALEIETERRLLREAESDIENGWMRLRDQQDLVRGLNASGHNNPQAERLMSALKRTLVEWERHRSLIEERMAYLENGPPIAPWEDR
jgi:hypothetical protein